MPTHPPTFVCLLVAVAKAVFCAAIESGGGDREGSAQRVSIWGAFFASASDLSYTQYCQLVEACVGGGPFAQCLCAAVAVTEVRMSVFFCGKPLIRNNAWREPCVSAHTCGAAMFRVQ